MATILSALGAISVTGGIIGVMGIDNDSDDNNLNPAGPYQGLIGSLVIATGVIEGAVSMPLFCGTRKEKLERNKFIWMFNPS